MVHVPLQVNAFTVSLLNSYTSCDMSVSSFLGCLGRGECWSFLITSLSVDVTMIPKYDLNIVLSSIKNYLYLFQKLVEK